MLRKNAVYLITNSADRFYFTSFSSSEGFVIISGDNKFFIVDSRYYFSAKKRVKNGFKVINGSFEKALEILKSFSQKELFVSFEKTSLAFSKTLEGEGFILKDCDSCLRSLRKVKTAKEINLIKKACKITESALKNVLPLIKEGVKEKEIANEIERQFKILGASGPSFETIVAFGKNSAIPHHETSNERLEKNSVVLIDFGCVYKGYCSDMTRTFYFGEPDKAFKSAYKSVIKAFSKAEKGITDGLETKFADALARDCFKEDGLDKFFTHSLGHGVGIDIHEAPSLSPKSSEVLENGQVFTIEPGLYFNGKFGIRVENTVVLENGKVKSLIRTSKRLVVIKP